MNRRDTVLALLALGAAPFTVNAQQQGKVRRIGTLSPSLAAQTVPYVAELRRGLRKLGYTEGTNIVLEVRHAEGKSERLSSLAEELVRLNVDVIIASSTILSGVSGAHHERPSGRIDGPEIRCRRIES